MNLGQFIIKDDVINELIDETESLTPMEAIDKAIRFTLMHDKDSIRDALYELAINKGVVNEKKKIKPEEN